MINVKMFREQHEELLDIAAEISKHLDVNELSNDAGPVKKLFVKLLGKLSVHLSLEDEWLYPKLLENSDTSTKAVARKFVDEMGGIGLAVENFKNKWIITSSAIQNSPSEFIEETKNIFNALADRIKAENNELYIIADDLQQPSATPLT